MSQFHHNPVSGNVYQGGNQVMLAIDASTRGFKSREWATFLQWKQAGYMVKKGEKAGSHIVKFVEVTAKKTGKDGTVKLQAEQRPRGYAVFNRDQVEPIMQMVNARVEVASVR